MSPCGDRDRQGRSRNSLIALAEAAVRVSRNRCPQSSMILVSGFNVYPNEIEEVIASHPGVLECAVIGIPDSKSGEAVKAFVVKKDQNLTAEAVIKFCHEQLTGYKVPKQIEFRTDLPKTNVGKILRRELRDEKKAAA